MKAFRITHVTKANVIVADNYKDLVWNELIRRLTTIKMPVDIQSEFMQVSMPRCQNDQWGQNSRVCCHLSI